MKQIGKILGLLLLYLILPLQSASAETLDDQINNLIGPKEQYNTMLSPVYLRTNEPVEYINPQSGELTLTQTDYIVPGRNGLDLEIKRIYKNSGSQVQEMRAKYVDGAWVDYVESDSNTSTFYEDRYNMGIGMRFSFPSIEVKQNSDGTSHNFLHTDSGDVYRLKSNLVDGEQVYLVEGQTIKDVMVKLSTAYTNGQDEGVSKFVLSGKDGKKTYFAGDGRLLGIVDRYGNTIRFQYTTLSYNIDGQTISKRLISNITDTVGRETTIEYKEDHGFSVGPAGSESYGANDSNKTSQSPNNVDSGDLQGKFQVVVTLPGSKKLVYDKSAVLVSASKHVLRTRLQRMYDVDDRVKYHFWYEQPDLGFTYFNGTQYSAYNRYENLVQVDYTKLNRIKRYVYDTHKTGLNEGSRQYRKIFESRELVKTGFDPNAALFLDKLVTTVKDKTLYTYTNEPDGYGTEGYDETNQEYLKSTYRYYAELSDFRGNTTKFTYDGIHQLILTEKQGSGHKEVITSERDEMKLIKKQEILQYPVTNGQLGGDPVKKIENYRYDEYGNLTNYTGPEAERDDKGYSINTERTVIYAYAYDKFHVLSQKTWKQDKNKTSQIIYSLDEKGNVIRETKVNQGSGDVVKEYSYDSYGNMTGKTAMSDNSSFVTHYEYGIDANGADVNGAYVTKEYSTLDGIEIAKRYAYDFNTGNRLAETDARGYRTSNEYDAVGRVVKTTLPDDSTKEYRYEDNPYANLKIEYTDPRKVVLAYEYDIKGDLVRSSVLDRGEWRVLKAFEYDAIGNKIKEIDANAHSIRYEYDSKNRIVNKSYWEHDTVDKGSMTVRYSLGIDKDTPLLVTITDEEGFVEKFYYDILDRLRKSEKTPDNDLFYTTTFGYDYVGNKLIETDGKNQSTRYTYDLLGRLIAKQDALGNDTEFAYNALNKVTVQREPGGKSTEIAYDALGRTSTKKIYKRGAESDYTYTSYRYDPSGNVLNSKKGRVTDGVDAVASDISYTYDSRNRAVEESAKIDDSRTALVSNSYDRNGNKTRMIQYADANKSKFRIFTYDHDFAGQLVEETGAYKETDGNGNDLTYGSYSKRIERDYAGNIVKEQAFNGSGWDTKTYTFNYRNRTVEKTEPFEGNSSVKRTVFEYDKKGNLLSETLSIQGVDVTVSYKVDGLGRIIVKIDPLGNLIKYSYDANGNRTKDTDPRYPTQALEQAPGKEYEYDAMNRMVRTMVFDGNARETIAYKEYDARGNVIQEVDGEGYKANQPSSSTGNITEYDMNDKKITFISAQTVSLRTGTVSNRYTYDGAGNLLTETDAAGNVTRYSYFLNGLLKEKAFADGYSETYNYDLTGKALLQKKDRAGRITKTFQTVFDKPYRIEYPDDTSETIKYSSKGEEIERQDQVGNAKYIGYAPSGNPIWKKEYIRSDNDYVYHKLTKMQYDEANRLLSSETFLHRASKTTGANAMETSAGDKLENVYDKAGRLTKISGPFGRETMQEFDRAGNITTKLQKVEVGNYEVKRVEFNIRSQVVKESLLVRTSELSIDYLTGADYDNAYADRVKSSTNNAYYKNGKIKSKTDSYGKVTSYEYDYDGRPLKKTDPLQAATVYRYDLKGNLVEEINSKGLSTQYAYDAINRMIRKQAPSAGSGMATTRYIYDAAGNLVKQIAPNDYDPAKDTSSLLDTMIGMIYVYDALNRRTATIAPDGRGLEYIAYNSKGQVQKSVNGVQYNGDMTTSKGTTYAYDGLGKVLQTTDTLGGSTLFAYDVLGNAISKTDARDVTTSDSFNPDGTLASVINPDGGKFSYTYDKLGRKTAETNPLGHTITYGYNAFGKEKTATDAFGYIVESKYDLNGNLVITKDKRGNATLMKYDANGKLVEKKLPLELDGSGNVIYAIETYVYDSLKNLQKKSLTSSKNKDFLRETTYTYYDNNLLNTESDNSGGYSQKHYDLNGNVIKVEKLRASGIYDIERYVYDSQNRMVQRIRLADAESFDAEAGFAGAVDLKDTEYPSKIRLITGYAYDAVGNKLKEMDPRAYAFAETDTANRDAYTLTFTYDPMNRLDKVIRKLNGADVYKQYTYDEVGNKISERNERGFATQYTYDYANRIKTLTDPVQQTLTYQYDLAGNKTSETNAKGYSMAFRYDKLNRLSMVIDPYSVVNQQLLYDENGNVVKKVDAKGYLSAAADEGRYGIVNEYDLANRLVKVTDAEQAATQYQYNPAGQKVQETNPLGQTSSYAYDAAGRLVKVTDAMGVEIKYEYDNAGNKLYMTDGRGKVTRYSYGSFGWMNEATNAVSLSIRYEYDLAGNVTGMTDRMGNHTAYTYDSRNLLLNKNVKETADSISYTYDEVGNRVTMSDGSGASNYDYDKKNQLLRITKDGAAQISYTYDALGNIESVMDKTGVVTTYTFDKVNRMETVLFKGQKTTYTYDENGNRKSIDYEGGVKEEYTFDRNNRLLTLINRKPDGSTISSYSYTHDAAGRQVSKDDSFGITNYAYDVVGRIEKVEAPGKTTVYAYDRSGNRQTLNETYTSAQPSGYVEPNSKVEVQYQLKKSEYVYSNTNELLKLVEQMYDTAGAKLLEKTTSYLYDENGNEIRQKVGYIHPHTRSMRQVTGGNLYGDDVADELDLLIEKVNSTYDGFNQLKQMEKIKAGDRVTVDYTYDGDGLRTHKVIRSSKDSYAEKVTNYLYDRQHVILETDASAQVIVRYVRGINYIARMDSSDKFSYYLYNGHGDVVQTVSAAGVVENQYDYDVFGNPTLTVEQYGNAIRYSGEFLDEETGLYYLRSRYYNPYTGRFTSEDTYAGRDEDPLSLNRYTYVLNNPIAYRDPTGHWEDGDDGLTDSAHDQIAEFSNAWEAASTDAERDSIHDQAEAVRSDPSSWQSSPTTPEPPDPTPSTQDAPSESGSGGDASSGGSDSGDSDSSSGTENKEVSDSGKENSATDTKHNTSEKPETKTLSDGEPMKVEQVDGYVAKEPTRNEVTIASNPPKEAVAKEPEVLNLTTRQAYLVATLTESYGAEKALQILHMITRNEGEIAAQDVVDLGIAPAPGKSSFIEHPWEYVKEHLVGSDAQKEADLINMQYRASEFTLDIKQIEKEMTNADRQELMLLIAGSAAKSPSGDSRSVQVNGVPVLKGSMATEGTGNTGTVGAQRSTGLALSGSNGAFKTGAELPGDAVILRGGVAKPKDLQANQALDTSNNTLSANGGMGVSNETLSAGLKNNQISVVSVGKLNDAGYKVVATPTANNPYHVSINTPGGNVLTDAEATNLSNQFTQVSNPTLNK